MKYKGVKMKKNYYDDYLELLEEAKKLNVRELFLKAFSIGYSLGFDNAVEILDNALKKAEQIK